MMTTDHTSQMFANKNILIIGDVMIDAYLFGKVDRISPEAPVPVVSVVKREHRPGGAANVALNISSLGSTPYLCGVIGNDEKAHQFVNLMKQYNLNTEGLIKDNSRPTTTKFRIIGNNMQMLRVDEESTNTIDDDIREKLLTAIKNILEKVQIDCIIFQDYDKGVISQYLIEHITNIAKSHQIPIVADPKRKNFAHFKKITLFKPNLKEFSEGTNESFTADNPEFLAEKMTEFATANNIEMMMVTLSDKGVLLVHAPGRQHIHIPAHLRKISDVSGAGDTVISVAALCLSSKMNAQTIAILSNLAGGLVCQYVGVVPIDKNEFIAEINRLNILA